MIKLATIQKMFVLEWGGGDGSTERKYYPHEEGAQAAARDLLPCQACVSTAWVVRTNHPETGEAVFELGKRIYDDVISFLDC